MGCWGYKSWECDDVMDCIDHAEHETKDNGRVWQNNNISEYIINEIIFIEKRSLVIANKEVLIFGIVAYTLFEKKIILPQIYIMKALRNAEFLRANNEYVAMFKNRTKKLLYLTREINALKRHLSNPAEYKMQVAIGSI